MRTCRDLLRAGTARRLLVVSADGRGVVSPAGSGLLADLADLGDRTTLTGQCDAG